MGLIAAPVSEDGSMLLEIVNIGMIQAIERYQQGHPTELAAFAPGIPRCLRAHEEIKLSYLRMRTVCRPMNYRLIAIPYR
jgi:hypothetical protein